MANPKIQLRHDTSTNWQTQNPILLEGEVAIETDSNKVKIGNGTDNYNTLPYTTDQTKINLDYSNADYQPVNKAGDTMSGTLNIDTDGTNLNLNNPTLTKGTNPSSTKYLSILMNDGSNSSSWQAKRLGMIEHHVNSNGDSTLQLAAIQNVANSQSKARLQLTMTQAGVASCSFPNTTCCDGQWVTLNQKIISSSTSLVGSSNLSYTVNVPNDGHYYEIIVEGQVRSNNTKNYWGSLQVITSFGYFAIAQVKSETDTVNDGMSCVTIPLGTNRNLQVQRQNTSSNFQCSCQQLTVKAYRRIGTNS